MAALGDEIRKVRQPKAATYNLVGQRLGRKGQETRDRILGAMSCLLRAADDTPITLSAVAEEASIGKSTLYLYFPDMADLVLAVLSRTMEESKASFAPHLNEYWADATLSEQVLSFTRAHFAFWQEHARLMQLRNSFADARDMRLVRFRQQMSVPVMTMLVRQMGVTPGQCDAIFEDCATVLLTGLERVATVVINPDFAMIAEIGTPAEHALYVERLVLAEARLMAAVIRDMRARAR